MTDLLDWRPPEPKGITYDPARDKARLGEQYLRVRAVMQDGEWRTLQQLSALTGDPQPSVSARLRDMRRAGYTVERKHIENGLWTYRAFKQEAPCCETAC